MSNKHIVEINGVKLEIDLRDAKVIDNFKVGDKIKVLIKEYSDNWKSHPGVIVGFDQFEKLPTIIIMYCNVTYGSAVIEFAYLNSKSKDLEICHQHESENFLDKEKALEYLDRELAKAELAVDELKRKKAYFLKHYNLHFEKIVVTDEVTN